MRVRLFWMALPRSHILALVKHLSGNPSCCILYFFTKLNQCKEEFYEWETLTSSVALTLLITWHKAGT